MTWHVLTENLGWKLGSLLLAATLWLAIVGEPELVTTRAVPVLYKNLSRDLLISSDAVPGVHLELRGPSGRLTSAAISEVAVALDLSSVSGPGERTFTLSAGDLELPDAVSFVRAVPSQLRMRFARRQTKEVPVKIRLSAPPPRGYRVIREEVTPAKLRVAGPDPRVALIDSAQTDALDLSGLTRTSEMRVNTFVEDPQVWLESSPIVTVRVTIQKTEK